MFYIVVVVVVFSLSFPECSFFLSHSFYILASLNYFTFLLFLILFTFPMFVHRCAEGGIGLPPAEGLMGNSCAQIHCS